MSKKIGLMGVMLISGAAFAADGMKLGGFVDGQYQWGHTEGGRDTNTFLINDGAVYLGKTMGMGEISIDIPFRTGNNPVDAQLAALGAQDATQNDNSLLAGFNKAQAWVSWKYENGFMWKLGQFDKLFLVESNDSADVFFSTQGLLYNTFTNNGAFNMTETGLQLGYDFSDSLGLALFVANGGGVGRMANGAGNPDMGFKITSKSDTFWAGVGGMFQRPVNGDTSWAFDVSAGTKMDTLGVDIEAVINRIAAADSTGFGLMGQFTYGFSDTADFGVRAEYTKQVDEKDFEVAVGPGFAMDKDLKVKLDYTFLKMNDNPVVGDATSHGVALAAVMKF